MFLHLGDNFSIRLSEVVSVHEYERMAATKAGQDFLSGAKEFLEDVSGGRAKSVVVTRHRIYLSRLSPGTLKKRADDSVFSVLSFGTEVF